MLLILLVGWVFNVNGMTHCHVGRVSDGRDGDVALSGIVAWIGLDGFGNV